MILHRKYSLSPLSNPILVVCVMVGVFPLLAYAYVLGIHANNIPYIDQHYWYWGFLQKWEQASGLRACSQLLLESYNSHRHTIQRGLILGVYALTGHIDLTWFLVIGNVGYVAYQFFWIKDGIKTVKAKKDKLILIISAAYLSFVPIAYINFTHFSFHNLLVYLFAILAIDAAYYKKSFFVVQGWAVCCMLSNANGVFIWFVLALLSFRSRNKWIIILYYSLMVIISVLFFKQGASQFSLPVVYNWTYFVQHLVIFFQLSAWVIDFPGSLTPAVPLVLGACLWSWMLIRLLRKTLQVLDYMAIFLGMTILSVAFLRMNLQPDWSISVVGHYKLFATMLLAIISFLLISSSKIKSVYVLLVSVLIFCINYYSSIFTIQQLRDIQVADLENFRYYNKWLLYPSIQGNKEYMNVNAYSTWARAKNIYRMPATVLRPVYGKSLSEQACLITYQVDNWTAKPVIARLSDSTYRFIYIPSTGTEGGLKTKLSTIKHGLHTFDICHNTSAINEPFTQEVKEIIFYK